MQLTKGETRTITLTVNNMGDIEGSISCEIPENMTVTFHEWEGNSIKADIICEDQYYKGGIIQFCFTEELNSESGSYCDVHYSVK